MTKNEFQDELGELRRDFELLKVKHAESLKEPTLREFLQWLDSSPDFDEDKKTTAVAKRLKKVLRVFMCQE